MGLLVYGYGKSVLKQVALDIQKNYLGLEGLISKMWETMELASGCGLAAPQIGKSIRLFLADSKLLYDRMSPERREKYFDKGDHGVRGVFINAEIISYGEELWSDIEGCLSVPGLSGKVDRPWKITLRYQNEKFETFEKEFTGATARVLQHEYDHIQGMLYLDRVRPLKPTGQKLMDSKLDLIVKGEVETTYKMKI